MNYISLYREKDLEKLKARCKNPGAVAAETIMNSFYRYCGLLEKMLHLEESEGSYERNKKRLAAMEKRSDAWFNRLNSWLLDYDLRLGFNCWHPSIAYINKDPNDTSLDIFTSGHFYN